MLSKLDSWLVPAPDPARVAWLAGVTYAHRGLHGPGRIENSPAAFAAAIHAGLGIECDVQRTADDRAAVFHDWKLDRLTNETGPVAARTMAELQRVELRGVPETIISLADMLANIAGRAPLLIELKSRAALPVAPLCRAVLRDLAGYRGPHAVMSFDARAGHWFARHSPATVRGLVASESQGRGSRGSLRRHLALWRVKPDFLACDVRDLPGRLPSALRARGLPVLAWTVATAALRRRALAHADGWIAEGEGVASALADA